MKLFIISLTLFIYFVNFINSASDKPCLARRISGRSVICVCNCTYCDDITREMPANGSYVTYTTSEAGTRFQKIIGTFQTLDHSLGICRTSFVINPMKTYQAVEGFGGAVTDAAAINWKSLPEVMQKYLIDSYFSFKGLEYNMLRVPVGGCDFSTYPYAYNEQPENDPKLSNYSLTYEDYNYKIPMIKEISKVATSPVHIVASTWSPPIWMKTNHNFSGINQLKQEYFETYALYHYKFLEKYAAQGINIWAITTTNEPINGLFGYVKFNSLGWSVEKMGEWIVNNLGPMIRNSVFKNIKILTCDDQRFTIPLYFSELISKYPKALDYIDGIGVHFYADKIIPPVVLYAVSKTYPDKIILATEACQGSAPWQSEKVELGSWRRAISYITDILEDLNHNVAGWIDWNLCLNMEGGPNWAKNYADSAVIVNAEKNEFYKQPIFYAMGHFSKFIKRGSRRIEIREKKLCFTGSVKNVAFLTPDGTVVVVFLNEGSERSVSVKCGKKETILQLEANSITTMEFVCDAY
ncbi:unnamed protein product [Parnassius apollo]|uniref:Glucosylceramidase n=1 Tax=Parnassius apollo TaxID=110799 RepID=A0A8S3XHN1_PARAO|nr:unnamed protein product [Parnassius apollo]